MYINVFFSENEKELETLIQTVRIYSQDIGMQFGIEKCARLVRKSGKRHITEGVELLNQVVIRTLGKKGKLQIFGHIRRWHQQQAEMKEKI